MYLSNIYPCVSIWILYIYYIDQYTEGYTGSPRKYETCIKLVKCILYLYISQLRISALSSKLGLGERGPIQFIKLDTNFSCIFLIKGPCFLSKMPVKSFQVVFQVYHVVL